MIAAMYTFELVSPGGHSVVHTVSISSTMLSFCAAVNVLDAGVRISPDCSETMPEEFLEIGNTSPDSVAEPTAPEVVEIGYTSPDSATDAD